MLTALWSLSLFIYGAACAKVTNLEFNVTWVNRNPDGLHERPVMGINNLWPIPALHVTKGEQLVVTVRNHLGNETTSLHWHGLYMNGTAHMDGPPGITQCEIPPGDSIVYDFKIDQPGTYWFHSHTRGQYPDGLRAPLIVHNPEDPFKNEFDEEVVLSFSDWYHESMIPLLKAFISVTNPTGAEPVPNSALINDSQNVTVAVQPGRTYLIRMVNMAAFAGMHVASGLIATFIEAPLEIQKSTTIPPEHHSLCARNSPPISTSGNAAGNTVDLFDLRGEPAPPAPLPAGFTTKGVIALVVSILNGLAMVAAIAWYGLSQAPAPESAPTGVEEPEGENQPLLRTTNPRDE
ncbi:hypothetical protein N0V95_003495 [Ascochyta clinopodiicola]|nr:hypothetical protein N0V95_003495 [Ascochyta clinopodiicola]